MRSAWRATCSRVAELAGRRGIQKRLVGQRIPEPEREPRRHVIAVGAAAADLAVEEPGRLEDQKHDPLDGRFQVAASLNWRSMKNVFCSSVSGRRNARSANRRQNSRSFASRSGASSPTPANSLRWATT